MQLTLCHLTFTFIIRHSKWIEHVSTYTWVLHRFPATEMIIIPFSKARTEPHLTESINKFKF